MRRALGLLGLLQAAVLGAAPAVAEEPTQAPDGAMLYMTRTCVACHGADGDTPILPSYPKLAGQNEAYLLQQMQDIKSGARSNGQTLAMKGIMHLVDDAEMAALAGYISQLTSE